MFEGYYKKELASLLGKNLNDPDGYGELLVKQELEKSNLTIPKSLFDYYSIAGKLFINTEHNKLYTIDQLEWIDHYLVFMEENQRVCFWGIHKDDVLKDDPIVWQGQNFKDIKWHKEPYTISDFLITMWKWILTGEEG